MKMIQFCYICLIYILFSRKSSPILLEKIERAATEGQWTLYDSSFYNNILLFSSNLRSLYSNLVQKAVLAECLPPVRFAPALYQKSEASESPQVPAMTVS